jgi:ferredoxin
MPKVVFVNEKEEIEVPAGAILREEALKAGVQVNFVLNNELGRYVNCRGHGTCGSCLVLVKKGMENLSPRSVFERCRLGLIMSAIGHEQEARLACQTRVNGDCTIQTNPDMNLSGENFWQKPYPNK